MSLNTVPAVLILLTCLGLGYTRPSQDFTQKQIDGYRQSVVRIDATGCQGVRGGRLEGSGFFWKQDNWVVTALHVVNGCTQLSVYSDTALDAASAHINKILFDQDLALLSTDKVIQGTVALTKAKDAPTDTQDILLVGFPSDSTGSAGKAIKRQFAKDQTLKTIASEPAQQELERVKSPALTITVIFLQAILEHGHSGGPIFDFAGDVIAIADGGLKHGTTEDGWAIPAEQLAVLESSPDALDKLSVHRSDLLFAASPTGISSPPVTCGGGVFKHLKTVSYSELLLTTDDAVGLQQLMSVSKLDSASFAFEVFQDLQTGATVALPMGETLLANAGLCLATSAGGGVTTRVVLLDAGADLTGQTSTIQFETQVMGMPPNTGWWVAPAFSYLSPLPVTGGGTSLRKNWVHYLPFPSAPMQLNFQQFDATQFETVAQHGRAILGVTALNVKWSPLVVQTQQACLVNPNISQFCPEALQDYRDWIASVLAVHLSTMAGL